MNIEPMLSVALALSYALGSLPAGLWLGLSIRGVDIREKGSKNIGGTNAMRVLGNKLGALALTGDIAKGLLATLLIARLADWPHAPLACGLAAILGHTFSMFLKFRGGKGVATSAGVFLGLTPIPILLAAAAFGIVSAATRMVSAGSICAALTLAVTVFLFPTSLPVHAAAVLVATLVILKHHANIKRMLAGTEPKIGKSHDEP